MHCPDYIMTLVGALRIMCSSSHYVVQSIFQPGLFSA